MGKTKKPYTTVHGFLEGKEEAYLLDYLIELYTDRSKIMITYDPPKGGNPNAIINKAILQLNCGYDKIFVWIDEDLDLASQTRSKLAKCWDPKSENADIFTCPLKQLQKKFNSKKLNPVLVVSHPICADSLILKILGKENLPHKKYNPDTREDQIRDTKNALKEVFRGIDRLEYYRKNLTKKLLEERREKISELNLLIKMISESD
jgi:hypothetical protein